MERQSEAEPERASGQAPVAGHERVADRGPAPALKPEAERIVVVGTSGSGKTTLARDLARRLGFSHIELDALNWEADWVTAPFARPEFRHLHVIQLRSPRETERWLRSVRRRLPEQ